MRKGECEKEKNMRSGRFREKVGEEFKVTAGCLFEHIEPKDLQKKLKG